MRAYLITTATLFGLLALAHLWRSIAEWHRLADDPWFIVQGPIIGIAAAVLSVWALRLIALLRSRKREEGS